MKESAKERAARLANAQELEKFNLSGSPIFIDFIISYLLDHPQYNVSDAKLLKTFEGWWLGHLSLGDQDL